jgi:hypothetical protein
MVDLLKDGPPVRAAMARCIGVLMALEDDGLDGMYVVWLRAGKTGRLSGTALKRCMWIGCIWLLLEIGVRFLALGGARVLGPGEGEAL